MRARLLPLFAAALLVAAPAARAQPAPAPENVEGSGLRRGGAALYVLPLLIVIALLIAILSGEDEPESP